MSGSKRCWVVWLMVVGVLCWGLPEGVLMAEPKAKKAAKAPELKVGPVTGTVFKADGKSPLGKVMLKVVRLKDGKVVAQISADEKGRYEIPELPAGQYRIIVAGRIFTDVVVSKTGKVTQVDFRIPATYMKAADPTGAGAKGGAAAKGSLTPFLLIGGGIAAAIAVPVSLSDGSSDDDDASATE